MVVLSRSYTNLIESLVFEKNWFMQAKLITNNQNYIK